MKNDSTTPYLKKALASVIRTSCFVAAAYGLFVFVPTQCVREVSASTSEATAGWVRNIADGFKDAFGLIPKISEESVLVLEGDRNIAELSVLQERFTYTYTWTHEGFLWSTKQLCLEGSFLAKAGYDLQEPFRIDVSENGEVVRTFMPEPSLNSLELERCIVTEKDGWLNELEPRDREDKINRMIAKARSHILGTNLLSRVDASFREQVEGIVKSEIPHAEIIVRSGGH